MTSDSPLQDDLKSRATRLAGDAKDAVRAQVDHKADALRDTAAHKAQNLADAAGAAASQFDADSLQARAAHQIADQVENVARHLRGTDLNKVVHDASEFARRNPLMFIGGAALLGLAATRFLKARDPQRVDHARISDDPWGMRTTAEKERFDVPS